MYNSIILLMISCYPDLNVNDLNLCALITIFIKLILM
jgi:hypothetical protein